MLRDLYVKMTEEEFLRFREMKSLENYSPSELAAALITSIKNNGGNTNEQVEVFTNRPRTTASIEQGRFKINLIVEK